MKPRYTDSHRWPRGYATAAQTGEAGYLKAKFEALCPGWRERKPMQTEDVVRSIKRVKGRTP